MPSIEERLDKLERTLYGITPTGPSYALQSVMHKGRLLQTQRNLEVLAPLTAQEDSARQRIALGIDTTWLDWTPTLNQSGNIALTAVTAKYCQIDKLLFFDAQFQANALSAGAATVVVGGLPVAYKGNTDLPLGQWFFYGNGSSSGAYAGIIKAASNNSNTMHLLLQQAWFGSAVRIAATDSFSIAGHYKTA